MNGGDGQVAEQVTCLVRGRECVIDSELHTSSSPVQFTLHTAIPVSSQRWSAYQRWCAVPTANAPMYKILR